MQNFTPPDRNGGGKAFTFLAAAPAAAAMQLYVVGEIVGLTKVAQSSVVSGASCNWWLVAPPEWKRVSGVSSGKSQCDSPAEGGFDDDGMFVFQHPMDVCFETKGEDVSLAGMPHVELEVRWHDSHGRSDQGGYGVIHVPAAPGVHELKCRVWRPKGSFLDRFAAFFVGGFPQLRDGGLRYGFEDAAGSGMLGSRLMRGLNTRQQMGSLPGGEIHLRLSVCLKSGTSGVADASAEVDPE